MIGGIVGKLLDTSAAKHDAETWERHYNEALQNWAAEKGTVKRLTAELAAAKRQIVDLQTRPDETADQHVLRLSADLNYARISADALRKQHREEIAELLTERDKALSARDVALRAVEVSVAPTIALGSRDRENALRANEENDRLRRAIEAMEAELAELRQRDREREPLEMTHFIVTEEHLALLRAMNWRWDDCEFGAPTVDPKRPFGSSSGIYGDMAAAVGWQYDPDDQEQEDELHRLYEETLTVLIIGFSCGSFEPGEYVRDGREWVRVFEVLS